MGVMNERPSRYAVMQVRNSEIKHWRGELRDYAVTRLTHMCMCAGMQAGACVRACMCVRVQRNRITA
jgi:hypothetical protein